MTGDQHLLVSLHMQWLSATLQDVIVQEVKDMRWGQFKSTLADAVVAHLEPIQQRYHEVIADNTYLDQVTLTAFVFAHWPKTDARHVKA